MRATLIRPKSAANRDLRRHQYEADRHSHHFQTEYFALIAKQNFRLFDGLAENESRVRKSMADTRRYDRPDPLVPGDIAETVPIVIRVEPLDSLDLAEQLYIQGKTEKDVAVLSMANAQIPGGAYLEGAGAQEEALCRRTTLYFTINPEQGFHPIPRHSAIFSPDVLVFRKSDRKGCDPLLDRKERWWTNIISIAAIARPPLNASGTDFARRNDKEYTREQIKTMLRVAAWEGKGYLVLSAFGCGAFRNPPHTVARLFREVLQDVEFVGRFQAIYFAIMDRRDSQNYEIFKDVLGGLTIWGKRQLPVESAAAFEYEQLMNAL
jgi:uncharacterized protein (TIGR02452 family)